MAFQLATWWLVIQIIGIAALPLTTFLLRSLPERGYAFSKAVGLLSSTYLVWLLAMFGLGSFSVILVLLAVAAVAGVGLALLRMQGVPLAPAPFAVWLRGIVQQHWRMVLLSEAIFLIALIGVAWLRAHTLGFVGPHPWGTERPMDFAFFNAIRYSHAFPPPDPWLAGYSINYYYFGYMMMAVVAVLSGLAPAVAYNLSLALIFALTAQGVAGIISTLIALSHPAPPPATPMPAAPPPARNHRLRQLGQRLAPLLGVILVLLAANQAGALQVIIGDYRVVALDAPQLASAVGQALRDSGDVITLPHPARTQEGDFGSFDTLERGDRVADFNWWWPSRALWDAFRDPASDTTLRRYNITEFPFFSFWLGDMHPHVMALPFNLVALVLALATVSRSSLPPFAQGRSGWLELLLTGMILGSLYIINSWDLPTYLLLYAAALVVLAVRAAGGIGQVAWLPVGKLLGMVLLAQYLLFLPFHLTFRSLVGFAAPLTDIPLLSRLSTILAPVVQGRSELHSFLIIFGLFLLPLLAMLYLLPGAAAMPPTPSADHPDPADPADHPDHPPPDAAHLVDLVAEPEPSPPSGAGGAGGGRIVVAQGGGALLIEPTAAAPAAHATPALHWRGDWLAWLPLLLLPAGLLLNFPLLALGGLMVFAFAQAIRWAQFPALAFSALVIALGSAICFGTEIVFIRDVFNNRMNTIFKFYYQVWLLWGTLAAFAVWWLLAVPRLRWQRRVAYATLAVWLVLLLGSLVYPLINLQTLARDGQFYGLAGTTPRENTPAGAAATVWIRANVPPGSIVLEAVSPTGGSYNGEGFAAISASTGRPTVIGWVGHQVQWRGGDAQARAELEPRKADVELIYSTTDVAQAQALLQKYRVAYVYIGELERRIMSPESLAKFDQLGEPVFGQDEVTIYRMTIEPSLLR
ncbi:MAG: hypothetical protein HC911_06485 [Chloroflexaceae bacterium]|nr:hypothetical protein [Chloroflexaceae bacterium]